jgi:hypothetical protein
MASPLDVEDAPPYRQKIATELIPPAWMSLEEKRLKIG